MEQPSSLRTVDACVEAVRVSTMISQKDLVCVPYLIIKIHFFAGEEVAKALGKWLQAQKTQNPLGTLFTNFGGNKEMTG